MWFTDRRFDVVFQKLMKLYVALIEWKTPLSSEYNHWAVVQMKPDLMFINSILYLLFKLN